MSATGPEEALAGAKQLLAEMEALVAGSEAVPSPRRSSAPAGRRSAPEPWKAAFWFRTHAADAQSCAMIGPMQNWEYKVFASHLDPAELVVLLNDSGRQGWELVTLVAVIDDLPVDALEPVAAATDLDSDEQPEVIQMQAFRYIFKRPHLTE